MGKNKEDKINVWKVCSNSMNGKRANHSSVGISNDCMAIGGWNGSNYLNITEAYNGSEWSNNTIMNTIRDCHTSVGIPNSTMVMGGSNDTTKLNTTEVYNGSEWANSSNMNSVRQYLSSVGITNNSMVMGGSDDSNTYLNTTEKYNGSEWANSAIMNSKRLYLSAVGITNSTMVMGGWNGSYLNTTEVYNGIVWCNNANMNSARYTHSGVGVTNDCMVMGGYTGSYTKTTEMYNGTIWYNGTNMNGIRYSHTGVGITNNSMVMGGRSDNNILNTTEIYTTIYPTLLTDKEEITMTPNSEREMAGSLNGNDNNIYLIINATAYNATAYNVPTEGSFEFVINLDGEKTFIDGSILDFDTDDLSVILKAECSDPTIYSVREIVSAVVKMASNINSVYDSVEVKQISKKVYESMLKDGYRNITYTALGGVCGV